MFSVRLNCVSFRPSHVALRSLASVHNRHSFPKQLTASKSEKLIASEKIDNNNVVSVSAANFRSSSHSSSFRSKTLHGFPSGCIRSYSTEAPSKVDVFGDLGNRQFEKTEMDEDEKAEEKFVENEARVDRRYRLTPGGYAKLIKRHIQNRDLDAALKVLDTVKANRDTPTVYMYNLLLRAFAVVGDFKRSRALYAKMKKLELPCNAATYTSIINACANYRHTPTALEYLESLRQEFMEKNIVLNETHYNAMIKAYGKHKELLEAFKIADEMRDKRLPTNEVTFNSLLVGAISDKEAGLRHALGVWHMMQKHKIKPTITTYNLLLRAIRDTKLGGLKVNDILVSSLPQHQIVIDEIGLPDLLNFPMTINSLAVKRIGEKTEEIDEDEPGVALRGIEEKSEEIDEVKAEAAASDNLPATVDTDSGEKGLTIEQKRLINYPLEKIHRKNRLILFGGVSGILERMAKDNAVPDTKTITLLMELVPNSAAAEKSIMKTARSKGIDLDIDFYNMLMKKRSMRKDYVGAKEILDDIQRSGLCPDIITWGILAMGCENSEDARDLIEGMKMTGHRLNAVIAGTLISIACKKIRFGFVLEIMETMVRLNVKPNWELYTILDNFQQEMEHMIKSKKFSRTVNHPAFKTGFSKFNMRYVSWQEEMGRKLEKKQEARKRT